MYQKPVLQKYGSFREVTQSGFQWCTFTIAGCDPISPIPTGDSPPESNGGGYDRS